MIVLAGQYPTNAFVVFLRDHLGKMVEDAINCRRRFAELFNLLETERAEDTEQFVLKYGIYRFIDYEPRIMDIGFLLRDLLKGGSR